MTTPSYLTRSAAAQYLTARLGRPIRVTNLEKRASQGTGPKFVLVLGRASYRAEDLDAWVERETRAPSGRRFGR